MQRSAAAESTEAPEKVTFEQHVKPIFRQHCVVCHNQGDKSGGLALDSFGAVIQGGGSGEVVYDDGDYSSSRLWQLINHEDTPTMPPDQDKIPEDQLMLVRSWIEGGILENADSKAKKKEKNALAYVASTGGKPDGPAAMPASVPQQVPVVTQRAAATTAIACSPWAPLAAVAGQHQIVLYHTDSGELLGVLPFAEGIPQSLRFSRNGAYLIAGGGEHAVRGMAAVYDVTTGQRVATVGDELDTVFDADANDDMSRIALGGPQQMLRIFDAADGSLLFDLKKHTDWIYAVAYSPDGVLVASGDRSAGLVVWEAETGRIYLDLAEHKGAINDLAWRDDSNVLASASDDGTVKLWDMFEGKAVKSINAHGGGVTAVQFDHQGRLVTAGHDNRVKLWDASGKMLKEFQPMSEAVLEAAVNHSGEKVVYGDWTGKVLLTSVEDPAAKQELAANPPPVEQRLQSGQKVLASIQEELKPLLQTLQQRQAELAQAEKPLAELNTQIAQLQTQAEQAKQEAAKQRGVVQGIDEKLPALVLKSRDAHDQVIAARLTSGSEQANLESVAAAEQKLGEELLVIATTRRERAAALKAAEAKEAEVATLSAQVVEMTAKQPPLQKAVETAKQQLAEAKASHDAVAARLQEQQAKMQQLTAAIE